MLFRLSVAAIFLVNFAFLAWADDTPKREPLYDIAGDFNKDGVPDRAVLILVGPGNSDTSDLEKERYGLGDDEHVDLAIYLGAGDAILDFTRPPDFLKESIADQSRDFSWVLPLEANAAGSLLLHTAEGWGSSHEADETLTLQFRNGAPTIIGYDMAWETREGAGGCSINLLNGKAERDAGVDGAKKKHFKVAAAPIALKDWKQPLWSRICD